MNFITAEFTKKFSFFEPINFHHKYQKFLHRVEHVVDIFGAAALRARAAAEDRGEDEHDDGDRPADMFHESHGGFTSSF